MTVKILPWLRILLLICILIMPLSLFGADRGIYINQTTLENSHELQYLINRSKKVGINTFIIDLERVSPAAGKNIRLVLANNIKYIARIIMFPGGGTDAQIQTEAYWQRKINLVQTAVQWGADEIQLDYIRYNTARGPSPEHAKNVHKIIAWYKQRLNQMKVPLQVDVFGITSFGEERHIGQSVTLFADTVNAMCPMVYPSHFEPFRKHAVTPYETVYNALVSLRQQFDGPLPFRLYPYIELSNYRYPLSRSQKFAYIRAQLKATKDAHADGWYAWSPSNWYDNLFTVLEADGGNSKINIVADNHFILNPRAKAHLDAQPKVSALVQAGAIARANPTMEMDFSTGGNAEVAKEEEVAKIPVAPYPWKGLFRSPLLSLSTIFLDRTRSD